MEATKQTVAYFKRKQRGNIYHYYQVFGGGKQIHFTERRRLLARLGENWMQQVDCGYQVVVNFLNAFPIIEVQHNYVNDALVGTWCTYEVGEAITEEEYNAAYERAISHPDVKIY